MSASLIFHAPSDLSVGWVRLEHSGDELVRWIATPRASFFEASNVASGIYTAVIEPLGQPARAYLFEVHDGQANNVHSPSLAVLGNVAQPLSAKIIEGLASSASLSPGSRDQKGDRPGYDRSISIKRVLSKGASADKQLAIGVSEDSLPHKLGGWVPLKHITAPRTELTDGDLDLVFERPSGQLPDPGLGARLRLSAAIERTRIERMMVPLFAGGVRIAVRASPLSSEDVTFRIVPVDLERRALTQALSAGHQDEAEVVCRDVLRGGGIANLIDPSNRDEDPWAAIVAALLSVRFPNVFCLPHDNWVWSLADRYSWITDVYILAARQCLLDAAQPGSDRSAAALRALDWLSRARQRGAPYFSYSNEILRDLLGGLSDLDLGDEVDAALMPEMQKWRGMTSLRRAAGASFSWLMAVPTFESQSDDGPSRIYTATRGNLDERYARLIFRGQLGRGRIRPGSIKHSRPNEREKEDSFVDWVAPQPPGTTSIIPRPPRPRADGERPAKPVRLSAPGIKRAIKFKDDPQKGRFGGKASRKGFTLSASFDAVHRTWVELTIGVVADGKAGELVPAEKAEFFLHDSFDPARYAVGFRGRSARLTVSAWGGFTVGVWLPQQQLELELDLAQLPGAPRIIRDL